MRPVCGIIEINTIIHKDFRIWGEEEKAERRRTFFHEMTHALAFSPPLVKQYIDKLGKPIPESKSIIKVNIPKLGTFPFFSNRHVTNVVKKYFNCPSAKGFPLVRKVSAHFHQQIIANHMMRPMADHFVDRISEFILTIYRATGWYIVNTKLNEETLWGKNKGCKFLNLECKDEKGKLFEEYCDAKDKINNIGCDFYYQNVSNCQYNRRLKDVKCAFMTPSAKNCISGDPKKKPSQVSEETGKSSKCFEFINPGNKHRYGACYNTKCDTKEKKITIIAKGKEYVIEYDENKKPKQEKIKIKVGKVEFEIEIVAPSFERFCFNMYHHQIDKGFRKFLKGKK
jgi:hypothetical protein